MLHLEQGELIRALTPAALALLSLAAGVALSGLLPLKREKPEPMRCAAAVCMGVDIFLALLLTRSVLAGPLGTVWAAGCAAALGLGLLSAAYFCRLTIFPRDTIVLSLQDKFHRRRLRTCGGTILAAYLLLGLGLLFLLCCTGDRRPLDRCASLAFALCALAGVIYGSRESIHALYYWSESATDRQYQRELLGMMQVIRSQRHDFNFHMQAVAGLIRSRRYEECEEYVSTMAESVMELNDILPLHDPATSALVNTFRELAVSRSIRLEVEILDSLDELPCTAYEINTILGNLLQNAVDEVSAAKDPADRWIQLLTVKRGRWHLVKVTNPCRRDPSEFHEVFRAGYSTKQSHEGIGLATVKKLAERCGGNVALERREDEISFVASIPYLRD